MRKTAVFSIGEPGLLYTISLRCSNGILIRTLIDPRNLS